VSKRSELERNARSCRRCTLSYSVPSRSGVGSISFYRYSHSGTSRLDYSDAHCGRWGFRHLEFWSCRSPFLNSALTTIETEAVICNNVLRRKLSDLSTAPRFLRSV
jgi:hypothetical protein